MVKQKNKSPNRTTCSECLERTSSPYFIKEQAFCPDCFNYWVSNPEEYLNEKQLIHSQGNRIKETAIPFEKRKAGGDTERVAVEINSHEGNTSSLDFKTAYSLMEEE